MVAVDRTPWRPQGETLASEEIPGLLPAGSSATTAIFSQTATGWVAQLMLSFITLLIATCMLLLSPLPRKGGARPPMTGEKGSGSINQAERIIVAHRAFLD